jgi:putative hemolysin
MTDTIFFLVGLGVLITFSAFFSGSETALFSLNSTQVRKLGGQERGAGKIIARLVAKPRALLISLLIGNMTVNIFASSLSASFFRHLLSDTALRGISESLSVATMTVIIIIFGEITPKIVSIRNSEKIAQRVAPFVRFLYLIVSPVRFVLFKITNSIVLLAGKLIGSHDTSITPDELRMAATLGYSAGAIAQQEKDLIHGVIRLEHRRVREIMTARMEIKTFSISMSLDEIRRVVREKNYTRIPVYAGEVDNIRGILYAKDLFLLRKGGKTGIADILKPAYFVPETLDVDILLQEFIRRHTHIAIVVDEYGSVAGLITLEDVLELIVGDIYDKVDEKKLYTILDNDRIHVKGLLAIEDFNEIFDADIEDEYAATIGGFVMHKLGRIPKKDEVFRWNNLEFKITKGLKNRIEEMTIRRLAETEEK